MILVRNCAGCVLVPPHSVTQPQPEMVVYQSIMFLMFFDANVLRGNRLKAKN